MSACAFNCGRDAQPDGVLCTLCRLPESWHGMQRDAELARKVKAGDLPGKVPEHYASMWDRRKYGTSL